MAQFAYDLFTGAAATTITSHTSDSGHTWSLSGIGAATANPPELDGSGRLQPKFANGEHYVYYSSAVPNSADYSVSVDVVWNGAVTGLDGPALRVAATSSQTTASFAYALVMSPQVSQIRLRRYDFNSPTNIATVSLTPVSGRAYRLTITAAGSTISGTCQDLSNSQWLTSSGTWQAGQTNCVSGTDATYAAAGRPGWSLYSDTPKSTLDNWSADQAGGGGGSSTFPALERICRGQFRGQQI